MKSDYYYMESDYYYMDSDYTKIILDLMLGLLIFKRCNIYESSDCSATYHMPMRVLRLNSLSLRRIYAQQLEHILSHYKLEQAYISKHVLDFSIEVKC